MLFWMFGMIGPKPFTLPILRFSTEAKGKWCYKQRWSNHQIQAELIYASVDCFHLPPAQCLWHATWEAAKPCLLWIWMVLTWYVWARLSGSQWQLLQQMCSGSHLVKWLHLSFINLWWIFFTFILLWHETLMLFYGKNPYFKIDYYTFLI